MAFPTKIARPTAFRPVRRRCPRWPRAWQRRQTKPRWPRRRRGRRGRAGVFGVGWVFSRFRHGFLKICIGFFWGISMVDFVGGWFKWFAWWLHGDGDATLSFWMGFFAFGVLRNCLHVFEDYSRALLNIHEVFVFRILFCYALWKILWVSGLGDGCGRRAPQFIVLMRKMRIHSLRRCLKLVSDIKWISKAFKFWDILFSDKVFGRMPWIEELHPVLYSIVFLVLTSTNVNCDFKLVWMLLWLHA